MPDVTHSSLPAQLDRPSYPAAEAGRLAGLTASRVRRWLAGYGYSYGDAVRHQPPVLRRGGTASSYASFLDLVDLLFVKRFLDHGVSLQKVRRALDEAHELLGTSHFVRQPFFTDGANIYLERVIAPVIRQLATEIDFGSPEGLARRWFPLGRNKPVVLDPFVSFGAPTVVGHGVKTANVHDLFVAENEKLAAVCAWWDLTERQAEAAVEFERRLAG